MGKGIVASDLDQIGEILEHEKTTWMVKPGELLCRFILQDFKLFGICPAAQVQYLNADNGAGCVKIQNHAGLHFLGFHNG
jgi:hypothetical protein